MTAQQLEALQRLSQALQECTDLGVLDEVGQNTTGGPDVVNDFCDTVSTLLGE